jgi:exodeoxyribonuclease VII small subunit
MPKETKPETFEQVYARLEGTVAKLEQGGLGLEESIALYEEGMTLARRCQEQLDAAEQRITKLRESFAPVPDRANGNRVGEEVPEYEYVADDDAPQDDEPFE